MYLLIAVWIFFSNAKVADVAQWFRKIKGKTTQEKKGKVTLVMLQAFDEAKEDLEEIVEFLKDPASCFNIWVAKSSKAHYYWTSRYG